MKSNAPQPFSLRLKHATRKVHSMAEQTTFIRGFLRGTACCESYLQLLNDLLPVYETMEQNLTSLAKLDHPTVAAFNFPELYRVEALQQDIAYLESVTQTKGEIAPSNASLDYAARIETVSQNSPDRLIGHVYTRYLGDLSGGQILARIASRSMGLSRNKGLRFYDFPEVKNVAESKRIFRQALDQLDGNERCDTQAIIDESIRAFHYNIAIFEHLQGNAWKSFLKNLPLFGHTSNEEAA